MSDGDGHDELWIRMFNSAPALLSGSSWTLTGSSAKLKTRMKDPTGRRTASRTAPSRPQSIVAGLREASRKFGISVVIVEAADGRRVQVFRLTAVQCVHRSAPGTISAVFRFCWIVALLDGLAMLDYPLPIT